MGTDSPSMGAFGPPRYLTKGAGSSFQNPLALESHPGHFKYGAVHTEGLINLDKVPNGSLYVSLPPKHPRLVPASPLSLVTYPIRATPRISAQCRL
jgi:hypothetical protein